MTIIAEKESKAERIEVRVTPSAKALLNAAAQARHTTISDFLLSYGIEAAEQTLAVPRVFYASEEGWAAIQRMLDDKEVDTEHDAVVQWLSKKPKRR